MPLISDEGLSPLKQHLAEWRHCDRCDLHKYRKKTCLCKGSIPADILIVGEAPGPSENITGTPFDGPAGKLFDDMISQARGYANGWEGRLAFTNTIACIPRDSTLEKFKEPPPECMETCRPRLVEFIELCRPKLVITAGDIAEAWIAEQVELPCPTVTITHPAAIVRQQDMAVKEMMKQRTIVDLAEAFRSVRPRNKKTH